MNFERFGGVCAGCGAKMVDYGWCPECQQYMRAKEELES